MEIVKITEVAKRKLLEIIGVYHGIILKLTQYGCSGKGYKFEVLKDDNDSDEDFIMLNNEKKLFIESMSFMMLIGCEIDYKVDGLGEEFIFNNPNATSMCGCGKSFS